jgi:glycosyltransferase involved in cell wall biosynthesis
MLQYGALIRETGGDLLFPLFPIGDYRLPCPILSWIPDLQHAVLPEYFSSEEIEVRDRKYGSAAKASDAVVLSSEAAREDFLRKYGRPSGRLEVLRFFTLPEEAWFQGDPVAVRERLGIPEDYLMVCNQFWAHKNHQLVIRALAVLKERGIAPFVVFTGSLAENRRGGIVDGVLQGLCEAGLWEQCRVLGQLDRVDQIQLLRGARAVVQPSLFEGWSTVLEDCRTLGKRVIASDLKVHREQDLPGATYFDPGSTTALADEIAAALSEPFESSLAREQEARSGAGERTLAFGRQFLRLAREIAGAGQ